MFLRKGVLKICNKFSAEHPCQSAISIKLLWNCTSSWVFSRKFAAYLQNTFFKNASRRLLLKLFVDFFTFKRYYVTKNVNKKWIYKWTHELPNDLRLKGALIQIWKSTHMPVFLWKYPPENFAFLILGALELHTRKACQMFVYKHTETIEYVKN